MLSLCNALFTSRHRCREFTRAAIGLHVHTASGTGGMVSAGSDQRYSSRELRLSPGDISDLKNTFRTRESNQRAFYGRSTTKRAYANVPPSAKRFNVLVWADQTSINGSH